MAKQIISKDITEIKKALETGNIIIGTKRTIKNIKRGITTKVFLASNCNEDVKKEIQSYCSINKVEIVELSAPNDELGIICKKPYSISVLSLIKE